MNMMPMEQIDEKRAFASLPPLIKGYLRLGGFVGDGAVVDPQFDTVDVSVVVVTDLITDKYVKHYREHPGGKTDNELRRLTASMALAAPSQRLPGDHRRSAAFAAGIDAVRVELPRRLPAQHLRPGHAGR